MVGAKINWGLELNLIYPYGRLVEKAITKAKVLLDDYADEGHDINHCITVMRNAGRAVEHYTTEINREIAKQRATLNVLFDDIFTKSEDFDKCLSKLKDTCCRVMTPMDKLAVILAALLHEVDDHKIFNTANYANARNILGDIFEGSERLQETIPLIIEMIDIVSCSKNGNSVVEPRWKLIPRDSDRIEALGDIGIWRAYVYTLDQARPLFDDDTPRVTNDEELAIVATRARFDEYQVTKKSRTMIDHFYDKVVHIGDLQSQNSYLLNIAEERMCPIKDFLFDFGKSGKISKIKKPN